MSVAQWRSKYAFLVWSNPDASDSVYLRAALLNPHLVILLDALATFGLIRLREEWDAVRETERGGKVAWYVDSMLSHFVAGIQP